MSLFWGFRWSLPSCSRSFVTYLPSRLLSSLILSFIFAESTMDWKKAVGVVFLLLSVVSLCLGAPHIPSQVDEQELHELKRADLEAIETLGPPPRPAKFKNKMELQNYLASLREYYSVIGRPRWVSYLYIFPSKL